MAFRFVLLCQSFLRSRRLFPAHRFSCLFWKRTVLVNIIYFVSFLVCFLFSVCLFLRVRISWAWWRTLLSSALREAEAGGAY